MDLLDANIWVVDLKQTFLGDADLDGRVDFADFLSVARHFGGSGDWAEGDFDFSHRVEFADFLIFAENFGKVSPENAFSVPEPNAGMLGLLFVLLHRRNRTTSVALR